MGRGQKHSVQFDALEPCVVTIFYFAREYVTPATSLLDLNPGVTGARACGPVTLEPGASEIYC